MNSNNRYVVIISCIRTCISSSHPACLWFTPPLPLPFPLMVYLLFSRISCRIFITTVLTRWHTHIIHVTYTKTQIACKLMLIHTIVSHLHRYMTHPHIRVHAITCTCMMNNNNNSTAAYPMLYPP